MKYEIRKVRLPVTGNDSPEVIAESIRQFLHRADVAEMTVVGDRPIEAKVWVPRKEPPVQPLVSIAGFFS